MFDYIVINADTVDGTVAYHLAKHANKGNMNIPASKGT